MDVLTSGSPAPAVPGRAQVREEGDGEDRLFGQRGAGEEEGAGRSECIADSDQSRVVRSDSGRLQFGTDWSGMAWRARACPHRFKQRLHIGRRAAPSPAAPPSSPHLPLPPPPCPQSLLPSTIRRLGLSCASAGSGCPSMGCQLGAGTAPPSTTRPAGPGRSRLAGHGYPSRCPARRSPPHIEAAAAARLRVSGPSLPSECLVPERRA